MGEWRKSFLRVTGALIAIAVSAGPATGHEPAPVSVAGADGAQWSEKCKDWDGWSNPGPPFRIWGDSWYVGTCGISAILISGEHGHVLIDGGPSDAGGLIAENIERLGFKLSDVKILLHSHEHFDHVGGLAELRRLTGARLLASPRAQPALESGKPSGDDPQSASEDSFPPVPVAGQLADGEAVRLGSIVLTPHFTPGHTPGALSWQWQSCDAGQCKWLVYADSLSPIGHETYRFSDHPGYVRDYRQSLKKIAELRCDIVLAPHPSFVNMRGRLLGTSPMVDTAGCRSYAQGIESRLARKLSEEEAEAP